MDRTHGMKCEDLTKTPVLDQPVDDPDIYSEFGCVSYNKVGNVNYNVETRETTIRYCLDFRMT